MTSKQYLDVNLIPNTVIDKKPFVLVEKQIKYWSLISMSNTRTKESFISNNDDFYDSELL